MFMWSQIIFILCFLLAIFFFVRNVGRIRKNISLGQDINRSDNKKARWKQMGRVALGQGKMTTRPIAGILHIVIYTGFILINIEVLEILLDGFFGTHRLFLPYLGQFYGVLIGFFEVLALLVFMACILFLTRRFVSKISRFHSAEMKGWPTKDASYILLIEIVLMVALITMNASDHILLHHFNPPISSRISVLFANLSSADLALIERTAWWFHIVGIFAFLNYLPFSKHFHIIMAFPNTWYASLESSGKIGHMESIDNEVKMMFAPEQANPNIAPPESFGAKDVNNLAWTSIMGAYACTECGRCTDSCPQNQTGKKLSPRKIMMDVRDRAEELGTFQRQNPEKENDGKSLHDYISQEELMACNTCNACVEACPVLINPLEIIVEMRRFKIMEASQAPSEWNGMFSNIENNGAPWQFSPADRDQWTKDLEE